MENKSRKIWEQAGRPAPEDFFQIGEAVPFQVVREWCCPDEELDEDTTLIAQDHYCADVIGNKALYYTFARGRADRPMRWYGMCEKGSTENKHPRAAKKAFIASPYRSDDMNERIFNTQLATAACFHAWKRGFFPVCPHLYFPLFLDDDKPEERDWGIEAGHQMMDMCDIVFVYVIDGRVSDGMMSDIFYAANTLAIEPMFIYKTKDEAWEFIKAELGGEE